MFYYPLNLSLTQTEGTFWKNQEQGQTTGIKSIPLFEEAPRRKGSPFRSIARRGGMKEQQETPPLEGDASYFPWHIIQNILSRLPVKSLLRLKTVCKLWNDTINDSGFAKFHSNQLKISDSQCFYAAVSPANGTYSLIKFQGQEFYEESEVLFPLEDINSPHFLCCCEGLLLFEHHFKETREVKYVLWNPFTRNHLTFSCPYDAIFHASLPVSYGLCFDKYGDDYKFIVVLKDGKYLVYSIKNYSWAERESEFRGGVYFPGTYAHGVVYWILSLLDGSCRDTRIIYFDPEDNLLKEQRQPGDLEYRDRFFRLTNLSGNLCFYTSDQEMIEIWLLKEYGGGRKCWMKLTTVNNHESPVAWEGDPISWVSRPMYLTSNNEVVFHCYYCKRYVVYCLEKQKFGEAEFLPAHSKMIEFTCLESLNFPATRRE